MWERRVNRQFWPETFFRPWPAFPAAILVSLMGSFLYVWLRVQPVLEYHAFGPYLYYRYEFLAGFLNRPGGLANYAGVCLAQLNCVNWVGALAFVLCQCGVFVTTHFCLTRISSRAIGYFSLVPLFLLLVLRNRYGFPLPAVSIGLLLALTAGAFHLSVSWRRSWLFALAGGLISGCLFFLGGLWSALLFAIVCCLFAFTRMRNGLTGLGCLLLALAAPLGALAAGSLRIAELVNPWQSTVDWVLTMALYASVPASGAVLALLPKWLIDPAPKVGLDRRPALEQARPAVLALLLVAGWVVVWLSFDIRAKLLAEIDYAANREDYRAVLAAAGRVKALNDPAKTRVELALYHTGRLADDLFAFHDLTVGAPSGTGEECRAQSQVLLELGLVNDAEHMACEALVIKGDRPDLLRLLARINRLKDRPKAAQIFLNVLSLIPFQKEHPDEAWPCNHLNPPMAKRLPVFLDGLRETMLTKDVLHDGLPVGPLLDMLLTLNPTNRMAFEYAMATHLLDLELKQVVERLPLLNNFPYSTIPRSYEEALLLFQELEQVQVNLKGRTIRPETEQRFREFKEAVRVLKDKAEGQALMAANFGDTYWYYYARRSHEQATQGQALTQ